MAGLGGFKIPAVLKAAASSAFAQSPLGQVVRQAQNARRLLGAVTSQPNLNVMRDLGKAAGAGDVRGLIRALQSADPMTAWAHVERYAASGSNEYALLHELLHTLGPVGRVLAALLPTNGGWSAGGGAAGGGGYGALGQNLSEALNMLSAFSDQPEVIDSLERILVGAGASVSWPNGRPVRASLPPGVGGVPRPVPPKAGRPPVTSSDAPANRPIPAPGASSTNAPIRPSAPADADPQGQPDGDAGGVVQGINVGATTVAISDGGNIHALPPNHPALTGAWTETPESSNVHSFAYDIDAHRLYVRFKDRPPEGSKQRPNKPGPIYAYYNVPLDLFMSMFNAGSKGTWVWDHLRIRGTLSGHKFDYSLVGVANGYVPRKATLTPEGESYIGRTVFSDKGRQLRSSRPDQLVRPLVPGRAPKTGRNGLGG